MRMCCKALFAVVGFLLTSEIAHAAERRNIYSCIFPDIERPLGFARIVAAGRTPLRLSSSPGPCPDESAACRGDAYLVKGDLVATGEHKDGYVCVLYPGKQRPTTGFVREDELASAAAAPVPDSRPGAWAGRWKYYETEIQLAARAGKISAVGDAVHRGLTPASVNIGHFEWTARPSGGILKMRDTDYDRCEVDLLLIEPYLAATDNGQCGGANVSFRGLYRRQPASKKALK